MKFFLTTKLNLRLIASMITFFLCLMLILFTAGIFSFQRLNDIYLERHLKQVAEILDHEITRSGDIHLVPEWLPNMAKAERFMGIQVIREEKIVYQFQQTTLSTDSESYYHFTINLPNHPEYRLNIEVMPSNLSYSLLWKVLGVIVLITSTVIFSLFYIVNAKQLKNKMLGLELLEKRSRTILAEGADQYLKGNEKEWPKITSEALDMLIDELKDARQERSRFDAFIRTHTFLDQLTGNANRVLFDNKLETILQESGVVGGVLIVRIDEWDLLLEQNDTKRINEFVIEVGKNISNIIQRYPDVILSRYYDFDFTILVPYQTAKEIDYIAAQCLKLFSRLTPPKPLLQDNWCHIGISLYSEGDTRGRILNEAEVALKNAQLQQINAWSRFDKVVNEGEARGSVRWRTLFDQALTAEHIILYRQPCYLKVKKTVESEQNKIPTKMSDEKINQYESNAQTKYGLTLLHYELFTRIHDPEKGVLKAAHFNSALETIGYEMIMDCAVLESMVKPMKLNNNMTSYSINLYVAPFANKLYGKHFKNTLLSLPSTARSLLSFEFSEAHLNQHLDYMKPVIKLIHGFGCKVIAGQAGKTVVNAHYIKELNIDFLKLHRGLIKQIDQRHENKIFIRSMLGACDGTQTQVIAVGVENEKEWMTLQNLGVHGVQGRLFGAELPLFSEEDKDTKSSTKYQLTKRKSVDFEPIKLKPIESKPITSTIVKLGRRNRWGKKKSDHS